MRSTSRRVLSFLLSAAMVLGTTPAPALAEALDAADPTEEAATEEVTASEKEATTPEEEDVVLEAAADNAQVMALDTEYPVSLDQDEDWLGVFTAPEDGSYVFTSAGGSDTYGELFSDAEMTDRLDNDDDAGDGNNFKITYTLSSSQTVYLKAYGYGHGEADFSVSVSKVDVSDLQFGYLSLYNSYYNLTEGPYQPESYVYDAEDNLLENADYELVFYAYDDSTDTYNELDGIPTEVGNYYVSARALGSYTGETPKVTLTLYDPSNFASFNFYLDETTFNLDDGDYELTPTLEDPESYTQLVQGTDYELVYYDSNESKLDEKPSTAGTYYVAAVPATGTSYTGETDKVWFRLYGGFHEPQVMALGEEYDVSLLDDDYWVGSFTAPDAGDYTFSSTGSNDTYGRLYSDVELTDELSSDDDGGDGNNFLISYTLSEGETVYLKAYPYSGSADFTVLVKRFDPNDLSLGYLQLDENVYVETVQAPTLKLTVRDYNWNRLSSSSYDLAYYDYGSDKELTSAPTAAGNYGVKAVGKGSYTGATDYERYRIAPATDLSGAKLELDKEDFEWTGSPISLSSHVTVIAADGKKLVENRDYKLVYRDYDTDETVTAPNNPGEYIVCARAIGSTYTGMSDGWTFSVYDYYDLNNGKWKFEFWPSDSVTTTQDGASLPTSIIYMSDEYIDYDEPLVTTRLTENTDYKLLEVLDEDDNSYTSLPSAPGNYTVAYEGIGEFHGTRQVSIYVYDGMRLSSNNASLRKSTFEYTSNPVELDVRFEGKGGKLLIEGTDFKFKNFVDGDTYETLTGTPTEPGEYAAEYEGMGSYYGTAYVPFTITDGRNLSQADLSLEKYRYDETGQPVDLQTIVTCNKKTLTQGTDYTLEFYDEYSVKLAGAPSAAGRYQVKAIPAAGSSYTGETYPTQFVIGTPASVAPEDIELGQTKHVSSLGEGYWLGRFVAPQDGAYLFASSNSNGDPYGDLWTNEAFTELLGSNDDANGKDFAIGRVLKKGETVYLRARGYGYYEVQCDITVTKVSEQDLALGKLTVNPFEYAATGNPVTPKVTVTDGAGKTLVMGTDYELAYEREDEYGDNFDPVDSATEVGFYRVKAVAKGSTYTGSTPYGNFRIVEGNNIANAQISIKDDELAYTGKGIEPTVVVTDTSGKTLVKNVDYELKFFVRNTGLYEPLTGLPKDVGTYRMTVVGKGSYTGKSGSYYIGIYNPNDLSTQGSVTLEGKLYYDDDDETLPAFNLSGSSVKPKVTVRVNDKSTPLVEGTDYTVTYANNTAATTYGNPATVTVKGRGAYTGELTEQFAITNKIDLGLWVETNGAAVLQGSYRDYWTGSYDNDIAYQKSGAAIKPTVEFEKSGANVTPPVAGTDFTVSYTNTAGASVTPVQTGSYDIVLTAKGSTFVGKAKIPFRIADKMPLRNAHITRVTTINGNKTTISGLKSTRYLQGTIDAVADLAWSLYDGTKQLVEGVDYTLKTIRNNFSNVIEFLFTGKGNYSGTVSTAVYAVKPQIVSMVYAKVTVPNVTYNGKAQKPTVGVAVYGNKLKVGTDFTVTYKNNVNAGKGIVTVTGKGSYTGSKSATFIIAKAANPLKVKAAKPSVKASKVKKKAQKLAAKKVVKVTGAQGKVKYKKVSGNKKIKVAKNGKVTIGKGLKKGTYKIVINVKAAGNGNYNAATKNVTVEIKVK